MNATNYSLTYFQYEAPNLTPRAVVLALVVSVHLAVLAVWQSQGDAQGMSTNQMSVNFAMTAQAPQLTRPQPPKTAPAPEPLPVQAAEQEAIAAEQPTEVAAAETPTPVAVVANVEPDYKAAYLNNMPPGYPMAARRNGLQGRVMLNVEVLANGLCGQISIHKSSGYAMLDNAALQTVKNWRFAPARQAGQTVDKWFMIPIQFSLKDSAA